LTEAFWARVQVLMREYPHVDTQEKLAKVAGFKSQSTVSYWLRSRRRAKVFDDLAKIARALNRDLSQLVAEAERLHRARLPIQQDSYLSPQPQSGKDQSHDPAIFVPTLAAEIAQRLLARIDESRSDVATHHRQDAKSRPQSTTRRRRTTPRNRKRS